MIILMAGQIILRLRMMARDDEKENGIFRSCGPGGEVTKSSILASSYVSSPLGRVLLLNLGASDHKVGGTGANSS